MFNAIANFFRSNPTPAAVVNDDQDIDAAYEEYARDMAQLAREERQHLHDEWNALTNKEMRQVIEYIDELNWGGRADEHRFYPYWKAIRCN